MEAAPPNGSGRSPSREAEFFRTLLGIALLGLAWPALAQAHPHAWIDVSVEVLFDGQGQVTALRQHWLFDEYYTADTVQNGEQDRMDLLTTRILGNLRNWGYFTQIHWGKQSIALSPPTSRDARMDGHRLLMTFTTPLSQPVSPAQAPLVYSIYDPTYFIEMLHAERPDAIRLENAPGQCRFQLIDAKPDPKALAKAAALDRSQTGGDGLGAQFAEKVDIRCAADK